MAITGDQARTAHLLRRFGLGASEAEIDYYGAGGWQKAVDRLLNYENTPEPVVYGDDFLKDQDGRVIPNPRLAQVTCYAWMLTTTRPLQAQMTLFWHDHFATSSEKVSNGPAMYRHWQVLQDNASGRFSDLLLAVSKNPAMLYWLDNIENVKGKPNENFAREVMELFTLGEGNYSEKDIQEAARAFTGWSYGITLNGRIRPNRGEVPIQRHDYYFDISNHDGGSKTVFGQTGDWNGDDVIRILCGLPRMSYYLTEKIWKWFVSPNPSKASIEKHAKVFSNSGLEIKALLRSIMMDEELFSDQAERKQIKNPIDFCIPTMRQLGLGAALAAQLKDYSTENYVRGRSAMQVGRLAQLSTSAMGMELLTPPDVSGWPSMTQWISTSTMVERMKWSDSLFGTQRGAGQISVGTVAPVGATGAQLVDNLLSVLDATLPEAKKSSLVVAAQEELGGRPVTRANGGPAAAKVARLLFSTPEFQFM
ncbi:MAG: DUF1800 family protein [Fimbriimonadaceae bacterium]